mmetsp:Transcript_10506/g.24737  ORF Transcript_10506/g.24737 Transcript_10506/m.24737 type:complete len:264 (-) Transcript_10506:186-977(-)
MATGVSSGRPWRTSPSAKICSAEDCSWPPTPVLFPTILSVLEFTSTRTLSRPSCSDSAYRPMANTTVSYSSLASDPVPLAFLYHTLTFLPCFSKRVGICLRLKAVPCFSMYSHTFSEHSMSKPRSGIERIMTVASYPKPDRNPAHSNATYDAPTTSVFPGAEESEKRSSLVMQHSLSPGRSGYLGRPPTAITNDAAVCRVFFPSLSVHSTVCSSTNVANALKYVTFLLRSSDRYPKLREAMWSCTPLTIFFQSCFTSSPTSQP